LLLLLLLVRLVTPVTLVTLAAIHTPIIQLLLKMLLLRGIYIIIIVIHEGHTAIAVHIGESWELSS
jgi:UTP-glucose-1-phosphate uridylyltransferase